MATWRRDLSDYVNRKGTLALRSNHINYGRAVLNCKWHLAREAEPKDYNFSKHPIRNLAFSTYHRLAAGNEPIPDTTYNACFNEIFNKDDYSEKNTRLAMIDQDSALHLGLNRETGHAKSGYGTLLPRHPEDRRKFRDVTTHRNDYQLPYPYTEKQKTMSAPTTLAYRRCNSQFTDRDDYRRPGRNTFVDESGLYANSLLRRQCKEYWWRNPMTCEEPQMWLMRHGDTHPGSLEKSAKQPLMTQYECTYN